MIEAFPTEDPSMRQLLSVALLLASVPAWASVGLSPAAPSLQVLPIQVATASQACNACSTRLRQCMKTANKCRRQICTDEELLAQSDAAGQCSTSLNDCLNSCGLSRRTR